MSFWKFKQNLYPLFAIFSSIYIIVFGLVTAKNIECSIFLGITFIWLFIFCSYKKCLKGLLMFLVVGGIFSLIAYFASGKNMLSALAMANRFGCVFLALIVGMNIEPSNMTRNLSQIRCPRAVTLGMLITLSFMPVLKAEITRVREATKTRGAGSVLKPKIFYRAFLIPFVTRLVDISDTLALSIETRGFTLGKCSYTVYKPETINFIDCIYLLGIIAISILVVVL